MINVLFVCLGNICRSPLAEGIFKDLVRKKGLASKISIDSAGTSGWHINEPPDIRSIDIAAEHGITLHHLGRQFIEADLGKFDYVLPMDDENLDHIKKIQLGTDFNRARVFLMREFDDRRSGEDVPDPYYGGEDGFQKVYDILQESLNNFLDFIIEEHDLRE